MLLAVLADAHNGAWGIATDHQDRGVAAAFDQHRGRLTLHRLECAGDTALSMKGTQCYAEHRHIHLSPVLSAQAGGQHLDKAHPSGPMHRFTNGSTGDMRRHAVVDQTGHHVTGVLR
jgi:hypothetical protein